MKIHFIGVGGIGVSALAQYYLSNKETVTGSDLNSSEITEKLKNLGASIVINNHCAENLPPDSDLVVYSPAIKNDNPEIKKANKLKIKIKSYPEALGEITKKYYTISVSGTHGKSTTSAMISLMLYKLGLDPTVIIGTKLKEFDNSNFKKGDSKYLVIEADEYKRSFLSYSPEIVVLTNIEEDHLDYYKDLKDILEAFNSFLKKIKKNGYVITNQDDENLSKLFQKQKLIKLNKIKKYSLKEKDAIKVKKILKVPGEHNVSNALAALEVARILKIKDFQSIAALSKFKGSWRRFEKYKFKKITLISDYAHHPTEVEKTLNAAREKFPLKKIRCVFQPHQHLRTHHLFDNFVEVIKNAPIDNIVLCEVYDVPGRENNKKIKKSTSKEIKEKIKNKKVIYKESLEKAELYIKKTMSNDEILIIMGAGDIYNLFLNLKKYLKNR
jgi:UDP-N-acetylmuramate--alanine ligase